MTDRAPALHRHGHLPDRAPVAGAAVGGHLISPHLMLPAARRVLLERAADDPRYALIVTRRHWALGCMATPGCILFLPALRDAVHSVRQGLARPADNRTAVDVELALLLERVLPLAPR